MLYEEWAWRHPEAAADLELVFIQSAPSRERQTSEGASQQQARLSIAKQGAMSWRNNVGATPARIKTSCPACRFRFNVEQRPVRYGLANDSTQMNKSIKSSDLILAIPRTIKQDHVGLKIAQFGAVECKRGGWEYTGKGRESAQAAWLSLVRKLGGFACFSTGEVEL